jgi:hypothetical protein
LIKQRRKENNWCGIDIDSCGSPKQLAVFTCASEEAGFVARDFFLVGEIRCAAEETIFEREPVGSRYSRLGTPRRQPPRWGVISLKSSKPEKFQLRCTGQSSCAAPIDESRRGRRDPALPRHFSGTLCV